MSRSTLVIGGGGFIGSHLVARLLASGRNVTVLGRRDKPLHALPEAAHYLVGDFSREDLIRPLLGQHHEVVHLAYATVPNTSYDNPLGDLLQNLPPTVQLFSVAAEFGNRLVLVSSGGTVYGEAESLPVTEQHPTNPISPYGVTKLTLERYAYLYSVTRKLDVVCVRPANAYGEQQRPFTGQGFIATAMASAMQGKPVTIFGESGTVRDYLHVEDLARGIVSALEHGATGETYNLGSAVGRSNLEVIEAMTPLLVNLGVDISIVHMPARPFDVRTNVLDSAKLTKCTGWKPNIGFEDGLVSYSWCIASR